MPYLVVAIIIILLLAIAPVIVYLYFSSKLATLQRQLLFMTRQNDELRNNMAKQKVSSDIVNIAYEYPNFNQAITSNYCTLYLSPIEESPIVCKVDMGLLIEVHDSAKLNEDIWYEISVPSATRVNNKGWLKDNYLRKIT